MEDIEDIPDFEIPENGQDQLAIGDFNFTFDEDDCYWGTGGKVAVCIRTDDFDRAIDSNLLLERSRYGKGIVKIFFSCDYTYPQGVPNKETIFSNGSSGQPKYLPFQIIGTNRLNFYGKVTFLDGWLSISGFLKDFSDDPALSNRSWPITIVRERTPDPMNWAHYEFSLEEALQMDPKLVSSIGISEHKESELPPEFDNFKNLSRLGIFGDNANAVALRKLPDSLGGMNKLGSISIRRTALEQLPESVFRLPNLQNLNISGNMFKQIPNDINLPKLQNANFSDNQLTTLPESLALSTRLHRLNLSGNPWASLPSAVEELNAKLNYDENEQLLNRKYPGANNRGIIEWDEEVFLVVSDENLHNSMLRKIENTLYGKFTSAMEKLAFKAVSLKTTTPDDYSNTGNSRFGGLPDLPPDSQYPMFPHYIKGKALLHHIFIAQLNCEELAPLQDYLPRKGILYFYLEDEENLVCKVVYHPNTQQLQSAKDLDILPIRNGYISKPYNPYSLEKTQVIALPRFFEGKFDHEHERDMTSKDLKSLNPFREEAYHTINEHPVYYNQSPNISAALARKGKPEDWMALLKVDFDSKCGFSFFDARDLCFMIHKSDLAQADFSNVFAVSDC